MKVIKSNFAASALKNQDSLIGAMHDESQDTDEPSREEKEAGSAEKGASLSLREQLRLKGKAFLYGAEADEVDTCMTLNS